MAASSGQGSGGEESDAPSTSSEAPPDWNSDDEPPQDHEGDEHTCSRDGAVKKTIRRVGRGLERPGQYDFVRLRFTTLQLDGESGAEEAESQEMEVEMGEDQLPLAIEFVVKNMRVGEVAEVRAPAAFAEKASPLCGRRLRSKPGALPKQASKVPRRLRFMPVAPRPIAERAKAALDKFKKEQEGKAAGDASAAAKPPMYRVEVELLGLECVHMLTEDRSVSKRLVCAGRSRRQPRMGDAVTFSCQVAESGGAESSPAKQYSLTLGEDKLPFQGLVHVLLSMKEGERCLAKLSSDAATDEAGALPQGSLELDLTLHRWRRHDLLPVLPAADLLQADGDEGCKSPSSSSSLCLRKTELHPGPEKKLHDIEAGSMVLVGLAPGSSGSKPVVLAWRIGEGAVPGYIEVAVASMRLAEGASFEAAEAVQACRPKDPSYDGQTPLRRHELGDLAPLLDELLGLHDKVPIVAVDACQAVRDNDGDEGSAKTACPYQLPSDWMAHGEPTNWEDLPIASDGRFRLALLAATEAVDVCMLEEDEQVRFLELERAHGNALARVGRFEEASIAYRRALDAVRRTPLYKALFPTERGHIKGAYSRDAGEAEKPLEGLSEDEVAARRSNLVALHLNLSLCAGKAGKHLIARKHADTALGAEPENAKALFRRGQAAAGQGDYEDALADLQKAAKILPEDRGIRAEMQGVQRSMREFKEVQKNMFQNVFQPAARKPAQSTSDTTQ